MYICTVFLSLHAHVAFYIFDIIEYSVQRFNNLKVSIFILSTTIRQYYVY